MDNKGNWKSYMTSNKINTLAQVNVHIGTRIELASWLGLSLL
jgi:hypothetical protein